LVRSPRYVDVGGEADVAAGQHGRHLADVERHIRSASSALRIVMPLTFTPRSNATHVVMPPR
jgi:hypothetical protein